MKQLNFLFVVFAFCSCAQEQKKEILKEIKSKNGKSVVVDSSKQNIIGEWGNCCDISNGLAITRNVCDKFIFDKDHTVQVIHPSSDIETLQWFISNDTIQFTNNNITEEKSTILNSKFKIWN